MFSNPGIQRTLKYPSSMIIGTEILRSLRWHQNVRMYRKQGFTKSGKLLIFVLFSWLSHLYNSLFLSSLFFFWPRIPSLLNSTVTNTSNAFLYNPKISIASAADHIIYTTVVQPRWRFAGLATFVTQPPGYMGSLKLFQGSYGVQLFHWSWQGR